MDVNDPLGLLKDKPPGQKKEMSRGMMTLLICGTLFVIAFIALGLFLGQDDPRYPGCTGFMGIEDTECSAKHALRHLRGY